MIKKLFIVFVILFLSSSMHARRLQHQDSTDNKTVMKLDLNSGSGSTAYNRVGGDGSIDSGVWVFGDMLGNSLDFNGTNTIINIAPAIYTASVGTFSFWFRSDEPDNATGRLIAFSDASSTGRVQCYIQNGLLNFHCFTGIGWAWASDTDDVIDDFDKWRMYSFVQDGVSPTMYIDAEVPDQAFFLNPDLTGWLDDVVGLDTALVGAWAVNGSTGGYIDGTMDGVLISSRAYSQAELLKKFTQERKYYQQ
jgi:hypothetical protein